jgi:hypothetical protein
MKRKMEELHPTLESIIDPEIEKMTWADTLNIGLFMYSGIWTIRSQYVARNPIPLVPDYSTRHLTFDISNDDSVNLLKKMKSLDISTRALFTAAGAAAMHRIIATDIKEDIKFWTTHEMDLRAFSKDYENMKGAERSLCAGTLR